MSFPGAVNAVYPTAYVETGSETAITNPGNAVDSSDTTFCTFYIALSSYSNSLAVITHDMTWFDSTNYDMTGMNVYVLWSGQGQTGVDMTDLYLVDETGSDFGSNMASGGVTVPVTKGISAFSQNVAIPNATYSHASFGVRMRLYRNSGSFAVSMYRVVLVPKFTRKKVTANYGFKIFDGSTNDKLSETSTFLRKVDEVSHVGGYTGTEYVYDFDDTKGVLLIYSHWEKWATVGNTQQAKTVAWSTANLGMRGHGAELPGLNFNNSTKVLTLSTVTGAYPLASGWDQAGEPSCGFNYAFVHYR